MEKMVNLKINGIPVSAPEGTNVLEAAREAGIRIPSLCYLKGINEMGACRMCVVEVKGAKSLVASCVYPVSEGMEVFTDTELVRNSRRITLELKEDGEGVYLTNTDGSDEDLFTADLLKQTILDEQTGYLTHPSLTCGPYVLVSYEDGIAEFELNEYYKNDPAAKE